MNKHLIYGLAGALALSTAMPAWAANTASLQAQPAAVEVQTYTRTIVVRETPIFGQQIVAALADRPEGQSFRKLMAANGLSVSLRENDKGYTAFVPVNHAFDKAGLIPPEGPAPDGTINQSARDALERHIVNSKFDVNLLHGTRQQVTNLSGEPITISRTGNQYYANGKLIVGRERTPEGILYFIEDFLDSPGITATTTYNPADALK